MTPLAAVPASAPLRVLVVHGEGLFCAGAQRMLAYFVEGADPAELQVALALAPNEQLNPLLPAATRTVLLPSNQRFTPLGFARQVLALCRATRALQPDVLHGWAARDWELTSLARRLTGRPVVGLLHDHPLAPHISMTRRRIMRACARHGLDWTLCVSSAVAAACVEAGYPRARLLVVRNGIPHSPIPPPAPTGSHPTVRLGYLGVFSERKGLRALFRLLDALHDIRPAGWELHLAGGAQDEAGRRLVADLTSTYQSRPWWPRLTWAGWIPRPAAFLATLDLLVVSSSEFDPFPTVLLEAGSAARPVFAARIGGVPEIVEDGHTGWLFDPADPASAAGRLATLVADPLALAAAGLAAAHRVRREFSVARMARDYREVYLALVDYQR